MSSNFWIGVRNALAPSLLAWFIIIWFCQSAFAQGQGNGPPNNRPPDNRPPGSGDVSVLGGDVSVVGGNSEASLDASINNQFSGQTSSQASSNANIEAGAMGDNNVNMDSKSLALVNTMGDVDINDCRESHQFGTPVFSRQWIQLNPWCAAEVYDAKGLHELAARTRCTIKEIRKLFDDDAACVMANTVEAAPPPAPPVIPSEVYDRDEELERRLEINQAYTAELESRLNELETLAQRAPEQRTVIQHVPVLSDGQKAKLAQLRDE